MTSSGSLCGLALTRALPDGGVFTAREILGLPVPAGVVVLSACEAGRPGAQSAATGLPPAFLAASALRAARDAVRADPRFAAPRHWAGWVLWGLPD